ncbi:MAG: hypothetical protein ABL940_08425 [Bacteroidia bacterium]
MKTIKYTLLTDGSSDKTLMQIINWLLNDLYSKTSTEGSFASFNNLPNPPKMGEVNKRVELANKLFPFDILFYHRDAESILNNKVIEERKDEVKNQINTEIVSRIVCIIPIAMMETWLLINETAIKKAADNPNSNINLQLPNINKLETIKNSKERLHTMLIECSGYKGRRAKEFNVHKAVHRVAEYITDYSVLREIEAFKIFENDLKEVMKNNFNM